MKLIVDDEFDLILILRSEYATCALPIFLCCSDTCCTLRFRYGKSKKWSRKLSLEISIKNIKNSILPLLIPHNRVS